MTPCSFHNDQSKRSYWLHCLLQYAIAFNDLHHFWLPIEQYKSIFQEQFFNFKAPIESEIDCVRALDNTVQHIGFEQRILEREMMDVWKERNFPETKKENVKILDDYLTLCENNNIRPIIFTAPVTQGYIKHFNKKLREEFLYLISEAQKKHSSAIFFDGWEIPFPDTDFYNTDHFNIQGAAKFSAIFNNLIEEIERKK